ncbi:MAG: hypothetical protein RL701_2875 [Pseudomonadota bacterium]
MRVLFAFICLFSAATVQALGDPAQEHFDAGARAFDEQRFDEAATEFERAYLAKPAWQLHFNLGAVYAALGRPVDAVAAYEAYLEKGAAAIAPARRTEVEHELARQRAKIGFLDLRSHSEQAEIRIDAKPVGKTPLARPIPVAAGRHSVEVSRDRFVAVRREITIIALESTVAEFELEPAGPSHNADRVAHRLAPNVVNNSGSRVGNTQRILGVVIGAAGLVGAAVGGSFLVFSSNTHQDALKLHKMGDQARAETFQATAQHQSLTGAVVLCASGAVFLVGAIMILAAPSHQVSQAPSFALWGSPLGAGASLRAEF